MGHPFREPALFVAGNFISTIDRAPQDRVTPLTSGNATHLESATKGERAAHRNTAMQRLCSIGRGR